MKILAVVACFHTAIGTFNAALSKTNLAYDLLGWANTPIGLTFAVAWLYVGVRIARRGLA